MRRTALISAVGMLAAQSSGQGGTWSTLGEWDIFPVHMMLLPTGDHNGKLLAWNRHRTLDEAAYNTTNWQTPPNWTVSASPFSSATKQRFPWDASEFPDPFMFERDIFCGGHTLLWDGRVVVAGGHENDHVGLPAMSLYDPANGTNGTWTERSAMAARQLVPNRVPASESASPHHGRRNHRF